jgi:uncharacterized membrane protein YfcA
MPLVAQLDSLQGHALLAVAALLAGAVNSFAGGGTILTFPVLGAILPDLPGRLVVANATSTIGLWPGAATAAWAYRGERDEVPAWARWLIVPSVLGAVVGTALVLVLPPAWFDALVPWLILTAALLFAGQPHLAAWAFSPTLPLPLGVGETATSAPPLPLGEGRGEGAAAPTGHPHPAFGHPLPKGEGLVASSQTLPLPLGEGRGEGAAAPTRHPHPAFGHPLPKGEGLVASSQTLPRPLGEGRGEGASAASHPPRAPSPAAPARIATACGLQFLVSVYGGYFGAGIGILMLAVLGMLGLGDIHRLNGVKNVLGTVINGVAAGMFALGSLAGWHAVSWPHAAVMAVASIVGSLGASHVARRLPARIVRRCVALIGFALAAYYFAN